MAIERRSDVARGPATLELPKKHNRRAVWLGALAAGAAVAAITAVVAGMWAELGDSEITTAGWVALGLGALVTLMVGVGLMTLVFISNRRGWDDGR